MGAQPLIFWIHRPEWGSKICVFNKFSSCTDVASLPCSSGSKVINVALILQKCFYSSFLLITIQANAEIFEKFLIPSFLFTAMFSLPKTVPDIQQELRVIIIWLPWIWEESLRVSWGLIYVCNSEPSEGLGQWSLLVNVCLLNWAYLESQKHNSKGKSYVDFMIDYFGV